MLQYNNKFIGFAIGIFGAIIGWGFILFLDETVGNLHLWHFGQGDHRLLDEKTSYVVGVCCNLIPFNLYKRGRKDDTMAGILFATLIMVGLFFVWYMLYPTFTLREQL